jgi:hypothetical protein
MAPRNVTARPRAKRGRQPPRVTPAPPPFAPPMLFLHGGLFGPCDEAPNPLSLPPWFFATLQQPAALPPGYSGRRRRKP